MFFGSIPALVTPFSGGRVAEDTFAELVEWQIAEGSNALVPCGTTGESATMSADEQRRVIAATVDVARGRVPVIAGCGSNNVAHAIEYLRAAADVGADAGAGRHGLLQPPEPGRDDRGLQGAVGRLGAADHRLQHSGPRGRRHLGRNAGRNREAAERRRREGRHRKPRTRHGAAPRLRRGFRPAIGQRRDRARLQRDGRSRLHLGHRQRRAPALLGLPEGHARGQAGTKR